MSAFHDNALIGASGQQGYKISRSVRLRSSASAYFNRTPASAGNRKTWTWSGWVKRGNLSNGYALIATTSGSAPRTFFVYDSDSLWLLDQPSGTNANLTSTAKFRDPSAWYHVILSVDTTQATSTNRVKMYVNGVEQTISGTYPTQNTDMEINRNVAHTIGSYSTNYFDGYLTEINFIDGQALTPSSFGETDSITGVWKPKKYAGTYGTNGFYLNFSDNSGATATTIGKDYSGNGNNWTPNNISVTAGVTYDSMTDVPTLTSATAANYCVWNPLNSDATTNGNLVATTAVVNSKNINATMCIPTLGKWYWEVTQTAIVAGSNYPFIGLRDQSTSSNLSIAYYGNDGHLYVNGADVGAYGATYTTNDTVGVAVNTDSGTVTFYKNGTSQGSYSYSTSSGNFAPYLTDGSNGTSISFAGNFGQQPWTYTPPTGFVALNTQNLPAPTISNGANYMAATTYTGNGTARSISNTVNGVSFAPDFVWIKDRTTAYSHILFDTIRGAGNYLISNGTLAELTDTNYMSAFTSTGFSVGTSAVSNGNTEAYVAWQWKAGGTAVSNTSGTITSTVSVGATQGFSVVTYTGTGTAATVGHGLGVAPKMIFGKNRTSGTPGWPVYHASIGNTGALILNSTAATDTSSAYWNNTSPTSSVFSIGTGTSVNTSTQNYVFYCFSEVAGYSKFGSYTGNGSADGPFVYCGFRPRFVMMKNTSFSGTNWIILDTSRNTANVVGNALVPNSANAEGSTYSWMDILSNGFKMRVSDADTNGSGYTYIYAAFAENPFRNSLAR